MIYLDCYPKRISSCPERFGLPSPRTIYRSDDCSKDNLVKPYCGITLYNNYILEWFLDEWYKVTVNPRF